MTLKAGRTLAAVAIGLAVTGCGSSHKHSTTSSAKSAQATEDSQPTGLNQVALQTGSDQQQITATIRAFYKATWLNNDAAACSLFSPTGLTGFMASAKVAFPDTVNARTTCPQVMAYFNADLADSADTLQQSGVNISGDILEDVGVKDIKVTGNTAIAQAPESVEELIAPKNFSLVRTKGRWLISGSSKIGQTLAQLLAQAKKKGELIPGVNENKSAQKSS
jgi:hypothetical protein